MKRSLRFFVPIFLVLIGWSALRAQWTRAIGPYGGPIYACAAGGTALFAGTGEGVYRSTDVGKSWILVSSSFGNDTYVNAIDAADSLVAAGTWSGTVYISTDGGSTWVDRGKPYAQTFITDLAISGSDIFAANPFGVYRSTDRGTTWIARNSGLEGMQITDLLADGPRMFAVTSQTSSGMIYGTTDRGESWTNVFSWVPVDKLGKSGSTLLAGTSGFGIYRSTDHGVTWDTASHPQRFSVVRAFAGTSDGLIASGYSDLALTFRSTDDGAHWSIIDNRMSLPVVNTMIGVGANLFAGSDRGMFISTNQASDWTHADAGLMGAFVNSMVVNTPVVLAGGWGAFLSTDDGGTWAPMDRGLMHVFVLDLAIRDTAFYAATTDGVYRASFNVPVWTKSGAGLPEYPYVGAVEVMDSIVFVGLAPGGVYRSTDNGASWVQANKGLTESYIQALKADGTNLWAGTDNGVYVTKDYGASWTPANGGWGSPSSGHLAFVGLTVFAGSSQGLFVSNSNEVAWKPVATPFDGVPIIAMAATQKQLFVGTNDGFYASTGAGTHWIQANDGLPSLYVASLAYTDSNLLLGPGQGGIYRISRSEIITSVEAKSGLRPSTIELKQNYPNPFNPTTNIRYQIPDIGYLKLAVYDLLGREVAVLVNEVKQPGSYEVTWNAAGFASGMYFCRMQAGRIAQTKKLLLTK